MTMYRLRYISLICMLSMTLTGALHAQLVDVESPESAKAAPLITYDDWWIGTQLSYIAQPMFGDLRVNYIGGSAPGSEPISASTQGGWSNGVGFKGIVEWRPQGRIASFVLAVGLDYLSLKSTSENPVANSIYAYNATYEAYSNPLYITLSPGGRMNIGDIGTFVFGAFDLELPISGKKGTLWQVEEPTEGGTPTDQPGYPRTEIRFAAEIPLTLRYGLHIGVGHDFLVGFFGYRRQLIAPYVSLHAGSTMVSGNNSLNGIALRVGVLWRYGV